jgi:hypothetical protein
MYAARSRVAAALAGRNAQQNGSFPSPASNSSRVAWSENYPADSYIQPG